MKAVRIHQHGGPEVLVYEDAPEPHLRPDQVLVRVRACALNHLDRVYPLAEMRAAPERVENPDRFGKVIVRP